MAEYVGRVLSVKGNTGKTGAWLLESNSKNARRMTEAMFFDPEVNWKELEPFDVLVLRACSPVGVFTTEGKGKAEYLKRVNGKASLTEIADAVFADDLGLVNGLLDLPESLKKLRPVLIQLVQLAYKFNIRPADLKVKNM